MFQSGMKALTFLYNFPFASIFCHIGNGNGANSCNYYVIATAIGALEMSLCHLTFRTLKSNVRFRNR